MSEIYHIAIDGPVASGKGTVARELGKRLGIPALDTGAMYRAVALHVLDNDIKNECDVKVGIDLLDICVKIVDGVTRVFNNGIDVTDKIRTSRVAQKASSMANHCREKLTIVMRELASTQSIILDGRDIASFVLPNAKYKFYLTASVDIRAKRRLAQMGDGITFNELVNKIEARDKLDMEREIGALKIVDDAIVIDNSNLNLDETVDLMLSYVAECDKVR